MKAQKYNKTAQKKQQHNIEKQHRHPEKYYRAFGKHHVHGNVEFTPEDDAPRVEWQILHVITGCIKGNIAR